MGPLKLSSVMGIRVQSFQFSIQTVRQVIYVISINAFIYHLFPSSNSLSYLTLDSLTFITIIKFFYNKTFTSLSFQPQRLNNKEIVINY